MSQFLISVMALYALGSRRFRSRSQILTATRVSRENYNGQQCVQDCRPSSF